MGRVARFGLIAMLVAATLPGCSDHCPDGRGMAATQLNDLEFEALDGRGGLYPLPLDTWTENPRVAAFLRRTVADIGQLAGYGLQCTQRPPDSGCKDCFICTKMYQNYWMATDPGLIGALSGFYCEDHGTVSIRAEIGPGATASAMTYWHTTPAARQALERKKVKASVQ